MPKKYDLWFFEPSTDSVRDALAFVESWKNSDCSEGYGQNFLFKLQNDAQFLVRFCLIMIQSSNEETLTEILVFLTKL
jgi:hypothetical protein